MEPVNILTFNTPEDAEPARQLLEQAGLRVDILDERALQKYFFITEPLAGIRLRVDKSDYERSQTLIEQWGRSNGPLKLAIHCESCGSSDVEFPQFTRKFVMPAFYAVLCRVGLCKTMFYCTHCHYTWPHKPSANKEVDALGWPKDKKATRPVS